MAKISPLSKIIVLTFFGVVLSGCGSLLVSGAGGGVAYSMTNTAYKTFSHPINKVEASAHKAIERMAIKELETEKMEERIRITASTKGLRIYIDLEQITPATTRVRVNAKRGFLLKDKSTATEIIRQMGEILGSKDSSAKAATGYALKATN